MKKALIYSTMVLLAGAMACNKTDHVLSGDGHILFAPAGVETRALVTNDNIQAETFQVYDFIGTTKYIDDQITYNDTDAVWDYTNADFYLWKSGTHKLFGFTAGAGTLDNNQKVTISKTLTTATADQTDLLYSEIVTQDAAAWKAIAGNTPDTPIALNFKHLLSAVSIVLHNGTDKSVVVNSVSGPAIAGSGSATVNYSGTEPTVSYATPTVSETTPFVATAFPANTTLASDAVADVLNGGASSKSYQVVWPQAIAAGAVSVTVSYTMNGTSFTKKVVALPAANWEAGHKYDYVLHILPTGVKLTFVVQDWNQVEGLDMDTKDDSINMSNVTWMNSKVFVDGVMTNTVDDDHYSVYMYKNAVPAVLCKYEETVYQTYEEDVTDPDTGEVIHHAGDQVLDENNQPIVLHLVDDLILDDEGNPTYKPGEATQTYFPAQAYFTVNYPLTGKYKIVLIPAYGETTVDASNYQIMLYDKSAEGHYRAINPEGETLPANHETIYFQIRATLPQDGNLHKAQINILFQPGGEGEWISAYSEVRANYACVIPASN